MHRLIPLIALLLFTQCIGARPTIGLVLAGGGARGAAHIGVLKYLEEQRIPVDLVTGTSFGAIVGGLYASGLSAIEIEELMLTMDWQRALVDDIPRADRSIRRKWREDTFSIPGSPGYGNGELKIPSGAIQGQNVILEMQKMTEHVSHLTLFSELPRPFKAIATDIVTGEMVVLDHGELAVVMRASMGVPAVFSPIEIEGRLLVDGGVTNNLPVDIARDMGADILIVVDITTPMLDREHIGDIITITDQLTRLLVVNNTKQQIQRMQDSDILLVPALGDFSAAAFTSAAQAIEIGYQAALNKGAELNELVQAAADYQTLSRPLAGKPTIRSISVENTSGLDDQIIRSAIDVRIGDVFNLEKVSHDMNRIHGLGNFELVSYQLDEHEGRADLKISATGKTWGPDYLHFGFNLDSEFKHDSRISFLLGYSREELTANGAEWITLAGIGDEPRLQTSFYLPLNPQRDWFVYADAEYRDDALYRYDGEKRSSTYALRKTAGSIGFGYEYGSQWRLMLGLNRVRGRAHAVTGEDFTSGSGFEEASINLQYVFDTRDDVDFPSSGSIVEAKVASYTESLGSDHSFNQWHLRAGHYFERKQHNLGLNLYLGGTNGVPTINSEFRVGGYGLLTGLNSHQLTGNYMGVVSVIYYQRYEPFPVLDGLIGATLEYGGAWSNRDAISTDQAQASLGAFIGADTPIGTLQFGFAFTEDGQSNIYSRIGRVF